MGAAGHVSVIWGLRCVLYLIKSTQSCASMSGPIDLLRRQYLQLVDLKHLSIPDLDIIKKSDVQAEIYHTMFQEDSLPFPPPAKYQLRVLKLLMQVIERAVTDPEEDVCFP